jgi:hypothetical protein
MSNVKKITGQKAVKKGERTMSSSTTRRYQQSSVNNQSQSTPIATPIIPVKKQSPLISPVEFEEQIAKATATKNWKPLSHWFLLEVLSRGLNESKTDMLLDWTFAIHFNRRTSIQLMNFLTFHHFEADPFRKWISAVEMKSKQAYMEVTVYLSPEGLTRNQRLQINDSFGANIPESSTEKQDVRNIELERYRKMEEEFILMEE